MHPARLFLVCGLPGSGKTTRATVLAERFAAISMSAGDWMEAQGIDIWDQTARTAIESIQGALTLELLRRGTNVVIEWGMWTARERLEVREAAIDVGAIVHLDFLDASVDELWERVTERRAEQANRGRPIERRDLDEWDTIIERPTAAERSSFTPGPPVQAHESTSLPAYPY